MEYDWFFIVNRTEFNNLGLTSRSYEFDFAGYGLKTVVAYRGVGFGLVVDDVYLRLNLNNRNAFFFDDYGILFTENNDVYLGFKREN